MRRVAPLLEHPELILIECSAWREYRVASPLIRGARSTNLQTYWQDVVATVLVAWLWSSVSYRFESLTVMLRQFLADR